MDRLDLSKNIIRGFVALDRFLDLHPEFKERLTFLALLQPSREDVEEYVTYRERVERIVADVNTRHGTTDWMPIDLRIQDDFPVTLAAYAQYDVLLVNAIADGMNLVAKEGPILNRRDGVLVLSEYAGAYEELGAFALGVNPFDIEGQAEALHRALTMPDEERADRAAMLRRVVEENSVEKWVAGAVLRHRRQAGRGLLTRCARPRPGRVLDAGHVGAGGVPLCFIHADRGTGTPQRRHRSAGGRPGGGAGAPRARGLGRGRPRRRTSAR